MFAVDPSGGSAREDNDGSGFELRGPADKSEGAPAIAHATVQGSSVKREAQAGANVAVVSKFELVTRFRFLLVLSALTVFQYAAMGPSATYITLNFFAESHGGGDCEAAPSSDPCRKAAADATFVLGITGALSKSGAWLAALSLGSFSDVVGRRPVFRAKAIGSLLPVSGLAVNVFFGWTLWGYIVISPLYDMFDVNGVFMALLSDVVREPGERPRAFGLFIAAVVVVAALTFPLAGMLPMNVAVGVSLLASFLKVAFVFTIFPETARSATSGAEPGSTPRRPGLLSTLRAVLSVVSRNSFIRRIAVVLLVSGFASGGLMTIASGYLTGYLGFTRPESSMLMAVGGVSIIATFVFLSGPLIRSMGPMRSLKVSLAFAVAYPIALIACPSKPLVFLAIGLIAGPMFLQMPIVAAIKSNLVSDSEQGLVQGALAAIRVLAVAAADAFFGWLYRTCTRGSEAGERSAAFVPFFLIAAAYGLSLILVSTLPTELPSPEARDAELAAEFPAPVERTTSAAGRMLAMPLQTPLQTSTR